MGSRATAAGKRVAMPMAWTDVPQDQFPVKRSAPLIDPQRLLEMAKHCHLLKSRADVRPRRRRRKRQ